MCLSGRKCLLPQQSDIKFGHSTITATTAVVDDVINSLDKKQHCVALFVVLPKAFDTVDHNILLNKLLFIRFDGSPYSWVKLC